MRTSTIKEVKEMSPKAVIEYVEGTLSVLYPAKRGNSNGKDWMLQNGVLKDDSGDVKLMFCIEDELPPEWKGKRISLTAHSGPKGLSGIYTDDNNHAGRVERQIKITATGKIQLLDGKPVQPPQKAPPSSPHPQEQHVGLDGVQEARKVLMRVTNAFYLIEKAVSVQSDHSKIDGIDCTPENFGGKCGTAYRELRDAGIIAKMPTKPLWGVKAQLNVLSEEQIKREFPPAPPEEEEDIPF